MKTHNEVTGNMRRVIITALLIIVCYILQSTVFPAIAFAGIVPNLLIVVTAACGFMWGDITGLVVGFISGLLTDIFFGDAIGMYAMIYMYIGYMNGKFSGIFFPEDIKLPMALILISDLFYGILTYLLLFMLRSRFSFRLYFINVILPEIVYTILVTLLLYPIILWIYNRLEEHGKRKA